VCPQRSTFPRVRCFSHQKSKRASAFKALVIGNDKQILNEVLSQGQLVASQVPQGSLLRTLKRKSACFLGSHFAYLFAVLSLEQPSNLGSPSFCAQVRRKLMSMHVDKELRGNEKSGVAGKGELLDRLPAQSLARGPVMRCLFDSSCPWSLQP
jgi:hypothetical protein